MKTYPVTMSRNKGDGFKPFTTDTVSTYVLKPQDGLAIASPLKVQQRLTKQIAEVIEETLDPSGVAAEVEASHMCMMMRGVEKQNPTTAATYFTGSFDCDLNVQERSFNSLRGNG